MPYQLTSYPQSGHCDCGFVNFNIMTAPLIVHACHCSWCQRETGSAFAMNALIESDRLIRTTGEIEIINTPAEGGSWQNIHRCPQCKIALWSTYPDTGSAITFIRVGTLDNPNLFPPDIHIYTKTKQNWLHLPVNVTSFSEFYDINKYWSSGSIDRYKRLFR